MRELSELVEIFEKYFNTVNTVGEPFIDNIWIRSNKFYVFFADEVQMGKTYGMFSKKYYMTVELTKDKGVQTVLDKVSRVVDAFREQQGLEVTKYEFWLPHCTVNGMNVNTKLIAESFGVSRELAVDYLIHYDEIFSKIYDEKKGVYFGLPLLSSYEEAENYILRDNTKEYLKGLKKLNKLLK